MDTDVMLRGLKRISELKGTLPSYDREVVGMAYVWIQKHRQDPVKPYRGDCWPKDAYCCGHCTQALVDTGENNRPKYCPECGKKVKWDEAD